MKLTQVYAKQQFDKIRQIDASNESILYKLTNAKDSINWIFNGALFTLCSTAPVNVKTRPDRLNYIFANSETTPGPELIIECNSLAKDLNAFYKSIKIPTEADYKICIKRVSRFIAFYSNTQIPNDIVSLYNAAPLTLSLPVNDLIDNPTTRVPVALCLDTSASMFGEKIDELNKGVTQFFNAILDDDIAKYSVELSIITFSSTATKVLDFANIERQVAAFKQLQIQAHGNTAMGAAVNMALDMLDARKKEYQDKGVDYWQPWLVLMTDGQPTDAITLAAERASKLVLERKLTIFPIGIGDGANMARLKQFSPKREPLRLKGLMLSEFFDWLGKSVKTTSQSAPRTSVKLPPIDWAYL